MNTLIQKGKKPTPEQTAKLAEGWRYVTIPDVDVYDFPFGSVWINQAEFKPGLHLVDSDIADELERILRVRQAADIRALRPTPHKKTLQQVAPGLASRGAEVDENPPET